MTLTTKKEMLEQLEDMIKFYSEDITRRSYNEEAMDCAYQDPTGRMCAVGRKCSPEQMKIAHHLDFGIKGLNEALSEAGLPEFLPINFWRHMQNLHDNPKVWGEEGLTVYGRKKVLDVTDLIEEGAFE